ncbi:protein-disulfide isomerase [Lentzea tibetensis]|uniref:Protein-disulfide isomerase n=1 Tax=Lentzea tibetensis TaxID=2591470 RepID=A0A563EL93_9PSEU|nr:thioredoxin domain-containing protein [Lentzea tibetensis]TWP47956.1 protein-disulfide isomerase [Lentzea tibetensis]
MGGAERSARKKKQAARAVSQARGGNDRTKIIVGVVVVVVLAVAVIGGVLWSRSTSDLAAPKPDNVTSAPSARDGAVVVVGKDTAKVTVDMYEDFLCPACGAFEKEYGEQIRKELDAGNLKVRYHMLPMLNRASNPEGYSQESANAALCAADAGKFPSYFEGLFAAQPREGTAGHDKTKLVKLGKDLGITDAAFEPCVQNGTYNQILDDEMARVGKEPSLQRDGAFRGTPTVVANGQPVDWQNSSWLSDLLKS